MRINHSAIFLCLFSLSAQASSWNFLNKADLKFTNPTTNFLSTYEVASTPQTDFNAELLSAPKIESEGYKPILLPMPNGKIKSFLIQEINIMEPELAARYNKIHAYRGYAADNAAEYIRLEITYTGITAMIVGPEGSIFIEPYNAALPNVFLVYNKKNLRPKGSKFCETETAINSTIYAKNAAAIPSGAQLRTYRLALAATAEYTAARGGSKATALSSMVISTNRVSGIYETELAIRFVLVNNTDRLIYTNMLTDPYTNDVGAVMLQENQDNCTSVIGTANFDIGHVFSTGGGGVANLGCVCSAGNKAKGVTGSPSPTGDAFDVDFVAHEIGHQFGANHTFNSETSGCGAANRNAETAYEPGSGISIMGYAGLCGADDLADNSIPYFHTASFDEIMIFTTTGGGAACAANANTGNTAPVVNAGANFTIPANTPFVLTGSATDAAQDSNLSYSWEEFDLGPAGTVNGSTGNAPIMRNFVPDTSASRHFPKLSALATGTPIYGEKLPTAARIMNFRLVTRDNRPMAGGVNYDDMQLNVVAAPGGFNVTSQNSATNWVANTSQTITWSLANTNIAPVNCALVDIYLSIDGGLSFNTLIKANEANDGTATITVPEVQTTKGRIMVKAVGNVFFDINNANIDIKAPNYTIAVSPTSSLLCGQDSVVYQISMSPINGFNETVTLTTETLPSGMNALFSQNNVTLPANLTLTLSGIKTQSEGTLLIDLNTKSASTSLKVNVLEINNVKGSLGGTAKLSPANNATLVKQMPKLVWKVLKNAASYNVNLSTDVDFSVIIEKADNFVDTVFIVNTNLSLNKTYFWKVTANNDCGQSKVIDAFQFTTTDGLAVKNTQANGKTYPNPTASDWNITAEAPMNITVTDALGRVVYKQDNIQKSHTINARILADGIYYAMGYSEGNTLVYKQKLVKTAE